MKIICAWCKKEIETKPTSPEFDDQFSHGVCPTCKARMQAEIDQMRTNMQQQGSLVGVHDHAEQIATIIVG